MTHITCTILNTHKLYFHLVAPPPLCAALRRARVPQTVSYGEHIMSAWYHSPLPSPFDKLSHLFVCPFTLKYFRKRRQLQRHMAALPLPSRRPPGERVYTSPSGGRQYKLSTPENPMLTAACDPSVRGSLAPPRCCSSASVCPETWLRLTRGKRMSALAITDTS